MKILAFHGTLSGSAGDVTASHNRGGAYLRFRGMPTNPETDRQTLVRSRVTYLSKEWGSTLTPEQREGWRVLADNFPYADRLGESRKLTGHQMYIKVNSLLLSAGETATDDAPEDQEVGSILSLSLANVTGGGNTFDINFTEDCTADEVLYVEAAMNVSPGKQYVKNLYKFAGVTAAAFVTGGTFTLAADMGNLVSGAYLFVKVSKLNIVTGAKSSGVVYSSVIA